MVRPVPQQEVQAVQCPLSPTPMQAAHPLEHMTPLLKPVGIGLVRTADGDARRAARERVLEAMRHAFRPEFLNRIDEIVVFHALTEVELHQIIDVLAADVVARLAEQGIALALDAEARALLVREGYNPAYGARPLRRTVQRLIETPLARGLLDGTWRNGDTIDVTVDPATGQLSFARRVALEVAPAQPAESLGT